MRQLPVRLTEAALEDLWQIGMHLHRKGVSSKLIDSFVGRIEQKCRSIGDLPEGYPIREDIGPSIHVVPFEHSAIITYRIDGDAVEITNVFYRGRDYLG